MPTPKRITIITIGSRGDVQPYVALGRGLKTAGFQVAIATYPYFRDLIEAHGLTLKPLRGDPKEILGSDLGQQWVGSQQNPLQFARTFIQLTKPRLEPLMQDALEVLADADLILYSDLGIVGYHVAEHFGTPAIETHLQPFGATTAFPSVGSPPWLWLGSWGNYFSHMATDQVLWQPFRTLVNELRRDYLNLPPETFFGPFRKIKQSGNPMLYAFSPHVLPKPADWKRWRKITGYWVLPPEPDWQPDPQLVDFLADGEPPVYIGFGSMTDQNPEQLVEMILTAVSRTNTRLLLSSGWAGLTASDLPDRAFLLGNVPHEWLLPKTAAVIHHGGAGTTAAGLRSGRPSLALPYFADQYFWANRIHALGAGPKPFNRSQLTVDRLVHALAQLTRNVTMQQRAADIGRLLQNERGVETAVSHIKTFLQKDNTPSPHS